MSIAKDLRPNLAIVLGAAVMLSLGMGVRQSFGLVMPPLTRDIAVTVSDFALAMSVQNLAWGFLQPVAGLLAARLGFRPVMLAGTVLYLAGLAVFASAQGLLGVMLGAGALIGVALACTASAIALAVGSVVEMFGLRWQAMIQGVAFMSHQLGSFLGAFGGGLLFDTLGSYDLAWRLGVGMGLVAGLVQVSFALMRPPRAPSFA